MTHCESLDSEIEALFAASLGGPQCKEEEEEEENLACLQSGERRRKEKAGLWVSPSKLCTPFFLFFLFSCLCLAIKERTEEEQGDFSSFLPGESQLSAKGGKTVESSSGAVYSIYEVDVFLYGRLKGKRNLDFLDV